jgi:hypothetical protein
MNDFIIDMGISIVLSAIKIAFKNNTSKESLKKALMKIKFQIELLYPDDEIEETPIPLLRKIGTRPEDF